MIRAADSQRRCRNSAAVNDSRRFAYGYSSLTRRPSYDRLRLLRALRVLRLRHKLPERSLSPRMPKPKRTLAMRSAVNEPHKNPKAYLPRLASRPSSRNRLRAWTNVTLRMNGQHHLF